MASPSQPHPTTPPAATTTLAERLDALALLPANWNGHGAPAPSPAALARARRTLRAVACLVPDRVVPEADGGIGFYWFSATTLPDGAHTRYAWLALDNDGDATMLAQDRVSGATEAWDVGVLGLGEALDRVGAFRRA